METTIGARIRELRIKKGFKLKELADKTNMSLRRLSDIELDKAEPKISTLINIATSLETTVGYLLCERENAT